MHVSHLRLFFLVGAAASLARAQVPAVSQPVPAQAFSPGGDAVTIDLRNHFAVAGVAGPVVQFETVLGRFNVELLPNAAPRHVENFQNYVSASRYANSFIHRMAAFEGSAISIVQGGGYITVGGGQVDPITKFPAVPLEYNLPNARGTLAAARTTDVNSATSEWFFNTRDNSTILGPSNGGGYTVFGRVIGAGMTVVDQIAALQRVDAGGPFAELPVRNYSGGNLGPEHLVIVNAVRPASVFPTGGGSAVVAFTVQNSAPNVVQATVSGSSLTLTPVASGSATVTVRAADTHGNGAETTIAVTVQGAAPVFAVHPGSFTAAAGTTVVLRSVATNAASYRWERNGVEVEGANRGTLVLNNVSGADAGTYRSIAINSLAPGGVSSQPATIAVVSVPATSIGRLVNLSIMSNASAGSGVLTVGAVLGPLNFSGSIPLLVRAVGPTLGTDFGVPGVLPDPVASLYGSDPNLPLATNDDWSADTANVFTAVGAFPLRAGSADSAIFRPGSNVGSYTVQVVGKGSASGTVLAEIYDAVGARTATTPRLINVSVNKVIDAGATLTTGFVLRGDTARTVLVRAVGPGLGIFGITSFMPDPKLALFNSASVQIADNDNWGGDVQLNAAGERVGAFRIQDQNSRDAMLLITLPPGDYSAQVNGVGGAGGTALVEVYEIP